MCVYFPSGAYNQFNCCLQLTRPMVLTISTCCNSCRAMHCAGAPVPTVLRWCYSLPCCSKGFA